jgi:GTP-binding nuclear protein Ran
MYAYKIVIVGDAGVGKTSLITRHKTGEFYMKYTPTIGVDVIPVHFLTNYGEIQFDVWDPAGQEKLNGMYDSYYHEADGAIAMFSGNGRVTLRNLSKFMNDIKKIAGDIPISICGNKCDVPNQIIGHGFDVISVKNNVNIDTPFLNLARQLTGHDDLVFEWDEF